MSWHIDWGNDIPTAKCGCGNRATHALPFSFGSLYFCDDCMNDRRVELTEPTECEFCGVEMYDPEYLSEAYRIEGFCICEDCMEEGRI